MKWILFFGLVCIFLSVGCSTRSNSLLLGGAGGLVVGGYTGAVAESYGSSEARMTNIATGLAIGAGIGVLSAYLLHKQQEERINKCAPAEHNPKIHFGELPPNPFSTEQSGIK